MSGDAGFEIVVLLLLLLLPFTLGAPIGLALAAAACESLVPFAVLLLL